MSEAASTHARKPVSVWFVYALATCNALTVFASQVVLSLYALKLGASPFGIGMLAATFSLFPMLLAVTAGRLMDRFGARWPMTFGAAIGGLGMLVPYLLPGIPSIYVAAATTGLSVIFFNLATQNLVGVLSTPQTRARNFSNYMLSTSGANLLAPMIGGFSIDHTSHAATCLFLACVSLVSIAMLVTRGSHLPGGTRKAAKAGGGVRAMLADPNVRSTLITGAMLNVGLNLFQFYMPVYGHSVGLSASAIGVVLAMNSSAAFVSRFSLPRLIERFGEARLLSYAFLLGATTLALVPMFANPWALAGIAFAFGLGMGCGQPIVIMLMYSSSRDGRSGEALGLKFTTNQLTKLVSPMLFGVIASAFGLWPMFWINAVMMIAGGLYSRPRRETPAPDAPAPDASEAARGAR